MIFKDVLKGKRKREEKVWERGNLKEEKYIERRYRERKYKPLQKV